MTERVKIDKVTANIQSISFPSDEKTAFLSVLISSFGLSTSFSATVSVMVSRSDADRIIDAIQTIKQIGERATDD